MKNSGLLIAVLFLTVFNGDLLSQEKFKPNCFYVEALGNGIFGSINYERQLEKMPGLGLHLGVGFYYVGIAQPVYNGGMNLLFKLKKENTFIDAGISGTFTKEIVIEDGFAFKRDGFLKFFMTNIGYRKHTKNNYMWRVNLIGVTTDQGTVPWVGIAFGKRF